VQVEDAVATAVATATETAAEPSLVTPTSSVHEAVERAEEDGAADVVEAAATTSATEEEAAGEAAVEREEAEQQAGSPMMEQQPEVQAQTLGTSAGEADDVSVSVPVMIHPVKAQAGAAVARGLPRCAMHVFRHVSKAAGTTMRFIFDKQVRGVSCLVGERNTSSHEGLRRGAGGLWATMSGDDGRLGVSAALSLRVQRARVGGDGVEVRAGSGGTQRKRLADGRPARAGGDPQRLECVQLHAQGACERKGRESFVFEGVTYGKQEATGQLPWSTGTL
jgi:hypothetical protein